MYYRFVVKRDTAANFAAKNTLLLDGEWGLELDSVPRRMKLGDGVTPWNSLGYVGSSNPQDLTGLADGDVLLWDALNVKWVPGSASGGGSSPALQFTAETGSTADSDPGNGLLKWNHATQGSASFLYLDDLTADGVSLTSVWPALYAGGFVYLQHATDQNTWQIWQTTAVTDAAGYAKLAVALVADGGSFADGDPMLVTIQQGRSDKQPLSTNLTALAALTGAADKLSYFTSPTAQALADFTSLARSLLAQTSASAMQAVLGITGGGATGAAHEAYEKVDFIREGWVVSLATAASFVINQSVPVAYQPGSGAVAPVFIPSELYHPGIIRISTGTTASSYTRLCVSCGPTVLLAGGEMAFDVVFRINSVSDATHRFQVNFGLATAISGTNERMFASLRDDVNSHNWYIEAADSIGTSTTNSTVAHAAGSWVRGRFVVNAAGTSVECFINGVSLGTVSSNISTQPLALFVQLNKVLGSGSRTMDIDVTEYRQVLAVSR